MRKAPDPQIISDYYKNQYSSIMYDDGVRGYFMRKSHEIIELNLPKNINFDKVLEVGAASSMHYKYVKHPYSHYYITDINMDDELYRDNLLNNKKLVLQNEDATKLSFQDSSFDRLIAMHTLEHLPNPDLVLLEWARVVRNNGVISLLLPCDPGVLWRITRYLGNRRKLSRMGFDYDYWMAKEHINPINNNVSFVRYFFEAVKEQWYPTNIPSIDINLFYVAQVVVMK